VNSINENGVFEITDAKVIKFTEGNDFMLDEPQLNNFNQSNKEGIIQLVGDYVDFDEFSPDESDLMMEFGRIIDSLDESEYPSSLEIPKVIEPKKKYPKEQNKRTVIKKLKVHEDGVGSKGSVDVIGDIDDEKPLSDLMSDEDKDDFIDIVSKYK